LFYGDITPFARVCVFARVVTEDLPAARAAGQDTLTANAVSVRINSGGSTPERRADLRVERPTPRAGRELSQRLAAATRADWASEPADVTRLRSFSRPPMGTMPCVVYANFDLFWAGENLQ